MIDLTEPLVPIGEIPDIIPSSRRGKRLALATVWRWCMNGARGRKLESVVLGGSRYTSVSALERFMHADAQADPTPAVRSPRERQKSHDAACRRLDAAGIV